MLAVPCGRSARSVLLAGCADASDQRARVLITSAPSLYSADHPRSFAVTRARCAAAAHSSSAGANQ